MYNFIYSLSYILSLQLVSINGTAVKFIHTIACISGFLLIIPHYINVSYFCLYIH